jgi:plasmid stabilization system protein ParE
MRQVIFTRAASAELSEAQDWYERESAGLGGRFLLAVSEVIARVSANPMHFLVIYKNVRRALLRRFPHAILFVVGADDTLTVVACFHGSRNPIRWKNRV